MFKSDFFRRHLELFGHCPELEPRTRPCDSCPVTGGMYTEISEGLTKEPDDVRVKVSRRWFCHTDPHKACRGNWNMQNLKGAVN